METEVTIERMLGPASIAIVGATERAGYGARLTNNLINGGFGGRLYPVNPNRPTVFDRPCYPTPLDLPEPPDLAMVVIPAAGVADALRQCAAAGAGAAIVISAGFAELGTEAGRARQLELGTLAAETGLRLLGPNCLGLANVAERIWATATTRVDTSVAVEPVGAALISQSGASAFGPLLATARERGVGFRYVISTGNEADLRAEDFVEYLLRQPDVRAVSLLIEGFKAFGRLRGLAELAASREKTLVVLKVGRSEAGQRAARSHTAALTGSDRVQDALFRQFGIARAHDYDELIEQTALFLKAPLPAGRRIGVVSHSGGIGTHLADLLGEAGLEVPPLGEPTRRWLAELLGERGSANNPADITTFAHSPHFGPILARLFADPGLDAWIVGTQGNDELVGTIIGAAADSRKPVGVAWTGSQSTSDGLPKLQASAVPVFAFPGGAARGMAALAGLARARVRPAEAAPEPTLEPLPPTLADRSGSLSEHDSKRLLAAFGIPSPPELLCQGADEAVEAAGQVGYPAVLKACAPELAHKSDRGLVRLDLRTPEEVRPAAEALLAMLGSADPDASRGLLVQPYVRGGVETIVGLSHDPQLGLLVLLGLGGTLVETLGAVTWRSCPIGPADADEMIDEVPALAALLRGVRGEPPADRPALAQALAWLASLGTRLGTRLESLDVNPLLVRPAGQGVLALDALAVLTGEE